MYSAVKLIVSVVIVSAVLILWILRSRVGRNPKKPLERVTASSLVGVDDRDREILLDLQAGKTSKLRAALSRCKQGRWEERAFYVSFAPHIARAELDAWCEREPLSADARILRAQHSVAWAWVARGEGRAHDVGEKDWKKYYQRLELAREDIRKCIELDRSDPTPWLVLLKTIDGANDPVPAVLSCLDEVLARDPDALEALRLAVALLGPRWFGSAELVLSFAREHAAHKKPGSEHAMLLFCAHFEVWFHLDVFLGDRAAADAWLASTDVRAELQRAYAASLGAPSHRRTKLTPTLRDYAAVTFYRMGDHALLAREFEAVGEPRVRGPWAMLGEDSLRAAKRLAQKRMSVW